MTLGQGGAIQVPVSGAASKVVIHSSPNLTSWSAISTNAIVNGILSFTDPLIAQSNARFYKLLVVP